MKRISPNIDDQLIPEQADYENYLATVEVLIDLSSVIDTVNNKLLLKKL